MFGTAERVLSTRDGRCLWLQIVCQQDKIAVAVSPSTLESRETYSADADDGCVSVISFLIFCVMCLAL